MKAVLNWSGGKDATLALHRVRTEAMPYTVEALLTTVNTQYDRVSQHGVRTELLRRQAEALDLPLRTVQLTGAVDMETYDRHMRAALEGLREQEGVRAALFGDIFLEDLRRYREERLEEAGLEGVFPLWGHATPALARAFIEAGFKAIVVCVSDQYLGRDMVGRPYDAAFLKALPAAVDPCGENGEFHTFVYDGPGFRQPIAFEVGDVVHRTSPSTATDDDGPCAGTDAPAEAGHWYCDLLPATPG